MSLEVAAGGSDRARESFEGRDRGGRQSISHIHHVGAAVAYEMSRLLNTGLDREQLSILISLCENGVNPEVNASLARLGHIDLLVRQALGVVVKELRREAAAFKVHARPYNDQRRVPIQGRWQAAEDETAEEGA